MRALLYLVATAAAAFCACSKDPYSNLDSPRQFFSKHKIGTGHDYGVIKFGNPEDHVLTVHGFGDDGAACYEIADALNANACKETHGEPCLNPYSCDALN